MELGGVIRAIELRDVVVNCAVVLRWRNRCAGFQESLPEDHLEVVVRREKCPR